MVIAEQVDIENYHDRKLPTFTDPRGPVRERDTPVCGAIRLVQSESGRQNFELLERQGRVPELCVIVLRRTKDTSVENKGTKIIQKSIHDYAATKNSIVRYMVGC